MVALSGVAVASVAIVSFLAFFAGSAQAQSGTAFTANRGTVTRISSGKTLPQGVLLNLDNFVCLNMTDLPDPAGGCDTGDDDNSPSLPNDNQPLPNTPFNGGVTKANGKGAPNVGSTGRAGAGNLVANFNGIDDATNVPLIGGHLTPPDQGLCVGPASALSATRRLRATRRSSSRRSTRPWGVYAKSGTCCSGRQHHRPLRRPVLQRRSSATTTRSSNSYFFTEIGAV